MKRYMKIVVAFILISLAAASCKAPCGCGGRGYGEINNADNQVEQRA